MKRNAVVGGQREQMRIVVDWLHDGIRQQKCKTACPSHWAGTSMCRRDRYIEGSTFLARSHDVGTRKMGEFIHSGPPTASRTPSTLMDNRGPSFCPFWSAQKGGHDVFNRCVAVSVPRWLPRARQVACLEPRRGARDTVTCP